MHECTSVHLKQLMFDCDTVRRIASYDSSVATTFFERNPVASEYANVRYRYRKTPGTGPWTGSTWSGTLKSKSETLVMQSLRDKHKGYEIELVEIKWR